MLAGSVCKMKYRKPIRNKLIYIRKKSFSLIYKIIVTVKEKIMSSIKAQSLCSNFFIVYHILFFNGNNTYKCLFAIMHMIMCLVTTIYIAPLLKYLMKSLI